MEGCPRFMKFILIGFNVIILIVGSVSIGVGVWALTSDYGAENMKHITGSNLYTTGCIVIIVGGSVIALVSFLGCCGAFTENRILLGIYFFIMLLFLILFVVGAALGFFFKDDLEDELVQRMESTLKEDYGVLNTTKYNKAVTDVWDKIQKELQCCGVQGDISSDTSWFLWQSSAWFSAQSGKLNMKYVPSTCCNSNLGFNICQTLLYESQPPLTNFKNATQDNPALFETGCVDKLKSKIDKYIVAIAGVAVVVIIVMLCCVVFSVCVCMAADRKQMVV